MTLLVNLGRCNFAGRLVRGRCGFFAFAGRGQGVELGLEFLVRCEQRV
jgi:hypothetical protein